MINFIVIVDNKLGMADDHGIPWPPIDQDLFFRQKTSGHPMIMGYGTYVTLKKPLPNRPNLVLVRPGTKLRPGFEPIEDLNEFLASHQQEEIWIIGGAAVFAQYLGLADYIYITRIDQTFACSKFFPSFEDQFILQHSSADHHKKGLTYHFETWGRKV